MLSDLDWGQASVMSHFDVSRVSTPAKLTVEHEACSLARNRSTILKGVVLWRLTGLGKIQLFKKGLASRHQAQREKFPAREIPDGTDGCALKS